MTEEAVVFINDEEKKVSELSDEQRYLHSQLLDLRNKRSQSKISIRSSSCQYVSISKCFYGGF